ncbi:MAG: histidine-type phosphatase [Acidobacteria bacterium]|nr:histidine-type phosphatase [Acidobacteriota bacterium]
MGHYGRETRFLARIAPLWLTAAALFVTQTPCRAQYQGEELRYAAILMRHGVRAPTWTTERLNEYSAAPWPDFGVPPGHLTPHGRKLTAILGGYYRQYLTRAGLEGLGDCSATRRLYIHADVDQRTLASGKAFAESIAPGCAAPVHSASDQTADPLFDPLEAGSVSADARLALAAVAGRMGPDLTATVAAHREAFETLRGILAGGGKAKRSVMDEKVALKPGDASVTMTGPLRLASTLTENLLLEYANGMSGDRLGWGRLNATNLLEIMRLHTVYAELLRRTPYLARIRGGGMLLGIARSIEQAAAGKPVKGALGPADARLLVLVGHDTNISNLSGLLDLSWTLPGYQPDDVPPGGALLFTLWRSRATGEYSVRMRFIAQTLDQMRDGTPLSASNPPPAAELFVPGCGAAGAGYPCPLKGFLATVADAVR